MHQQINRKHRQSSQSPWVKPRADLFVLFASSPRARVKLTAGAFAKPLINWISIAKSVYACPRNVNLGPWEAYRRMDKRAGGAVDGRVSSPSRLRRSSSEWRSKRGRAYLQCILNCFLTIVSATYKQNGIPPPPCTLGGYEFRRWSFENLAAARPRPLSRAVFQGNAHVLAAALPPRARRQTRYGIKYPREIFLSCRVLNERS